MKRRYIVDEALSWVGTPYHHQAAVKSVGCDCVGLLRGVYSRITGTPVQNPENYSAAWHIHNTEEKLYTYLRDYFKLNEKPFSQRQPGDIVVFAMGKGPGAHTAIVLPNDRIVHALRESKGVVNHKLDEKWQKRLHSCFEFPGVLD